MLHNITLMPGSTVDCRGVARVRHARGRHAEAAARRGLQELRRQHRSPRLSASVRLARCCRTYAVMGHSLLLKAWAFLYAAATALCIIASRKQ